MPQSHYVHLVDSSSLRRAKLAREITSRGLHAEIYETVEELRRTAQRGGYPGQGAVLVNDDDGVDVAALLGDMRAAGCFLAVIAFTDGEPQARRIVGAMRAGAVDYLRFPDDLGIVGRIVEDVIAHAKGLASHYAMTALAQTRVARLSRQERRVLESVIAGATSKEAARDMGISNRTVEVHRAAVLHKLEVATSAGAIATGIAAGMMTALGEPDDLASADPFEPQRSLGGIGFYQPHVQRIARGYPVGIHAGEYRKAG